LANSQSRPAADIVKRHPNHVKIQFYALLSMSGDRRRRVRRMQELKENFCISRISNQGLLKATRNDYFYYLLNTTAWQLIRVNKE
jgi:hypothetical protein